MGASRTNGWTRLESTRYKTVVESDHSKVSSDEQDATGWLYVNVRSHGKYTCLVFLEGKLIEQAPATTQNVAYLNVCQRLRQQGFEFPWLDG